jgi:predicted nucleotidyltransferase
MPPELTRTVAQFFAARPGVLAAYVFGSRAKGRPGKRSDLDVAVLFEARAESRPSRLARHEKLAIWQDEMEQLVGLPVDLIDLSEAGVILSHEVLARGFKVLESEPSRVRQFEARALTAYLDFQPLEERFASAAIRAVRRDARW